MAFYGPRITKAKILPVPIAHACCTAAPTLFDLDGHLLPPPSFQGIWIWGQARRGLSISHRVLSRISFHSYEKKRERKAHGIT